RRRTGWPTERQWRERGSRAGGNRHRGTWPGRSGSWTQSSRGATDRLTRTASDDPHGGWIPGRGIRWETELRSWQPVQARPDADRGRMPACPQVGVPSCGHFFVRPRTEVGMQKVKEEAIEVEGRVKTALPNTTFRVELDIGGEVIARIAGKMR